MVAGWSYGKCRAPFAVLIVCATDKCCALAVQWSKPFWPAFGTVTHFVDNTTAVWDYVERGQVTQADDGSPLVLFVGRGYENIHTLAMMFCQANDTDCVTTIQ